MAGDAMKKVQPGDRLKIPAETFNTFIDAARAFRADQQNFGAEARLELRDRDVVLVKNQSGTDRQRFDVLGIADALITPTNNLDEFQNRSPLTGVAPTIAEHVRRFVVLLEPVANGAIARAAIAGIVPVRLKVVYDWHQFAHIADGDSTHLVSDCVGFPVLWKDSAGNEDENGNHWALVKIGGPGVSLGVWKNTGAATVAAHEQFRVTGCEVDGNCLTGRQPDSAHGRQYETNGSTPVPAGKHGVYQKAAVIHVAYAGDSPSTGDRLGPKPGQGTVVKDDPAFVTCDALGVADETNKIVQARVHAAQGERCVVLRMKSAEAVVLPPDPIRENWTFQVSDPVELWRAENAPNYEPPDEVLNTIGSSLDAGDPVVVLGVYALVGDEYQYLWYAVGTTNTSAVRTVVLTRDYFGGGGINCVWGHFEDDPDQVEHPFTPLGYIDNPSHGILGFAPAGARAVVIVSLWRPFLLLGVEQGLPEDSPGIVIGGEFQTLLEGVVYGSAIERDGTGMVTPYWLDADGEFVQAGTLPIMSVRNFIRRVEAGERVQIHLNPARGYWAIVAAGDAKDEKVKADADDPQAGYLDEKLVTEDPWIGKETIAPEGEPHALKLRHTGPSTVYCTDDLLGTVEIITDPPDNYNLQLIDERYSMLRPEEHTAMVPQTERERYENFFKGSGDVVNTLVCTPTLELGVDIGALDSVLLRNVPRFGDHVPNGPTLHRGGGAQCPDQRL